MLQAPSIKGPPSLLQPHSTRGLSDLTSTMEWLDLVSSQPSIFELGPQAQVCAQHVPWNTGFACRQVPFLNLSQLFLSTHWLASYLTRNEDEILLLHSQIPWHLWFLDSGQEREEAWDHLGFLSLQIDADVFDIASGQKNLASYRRKLTLCRKIWLLDVLK